MVNDESDTGMQAGHGSEIDGEYGGVVEAIASAIRYPAESDDVVKTVLIGGLLALFGFLIVPLFVLAGYVVRVYDRTAAGDEVPPVFDDLAEMTVTGIKAAVIGIVYGFVPLLVGGAVVLVGIVGVGVGGDGALGGLGVLGILVGGIVWLALALLVGYLLPAALANFARTRSIGSGFDVGTLKPVWTSRSYAVAWVTMFAVLLIGGVVAAVLNVVPILGTVAGAFVGFYFSVAAYSVIGRSWSGFPGVGRVRPVTSETL
ncbi:DUF4013 domain-containing protein [Halorubrum sp. DTA46]|uniref:DUF4013 domain-containing protein n=1 Tax=Halorubrum sp. DTA46 TaxID=3402162 RepID=UPI003AACBA17